MRPVSIATLVVALVCMWVTRHAWRSPWERPALVNVSLQTVKLLVVAPVWNFWLSSKLHAFTGIWNLEELIAHVCYIVGMLSLLFMVVSRLDMTNAQLQSFVRYRIEIPGIIVISLMIGLFVFGPGKQYVPDTVTAPTTDWLRAYWLVVAVFLSFLLFQVAQALWVLRTDPRSRRAANAYLCAVSLSAAGIIAFQLEIGWMQWLVIRLEVVGYAVAASYTWHSKQRVDVPSDYLLPG